MAGVTVTDGVSPVDDELQLYLAKAAEFIDDALKNLTAVPLSPVPAIIDTIAEFYASGLYLQKAIEPNGEHPNVVLAERKLLEFASSLKHGFKLVSS
jgi:hypothetical protein